MYPFRSNHAAARLVALLGVAVLATACSSDSPTGPGSSQFDVSGAIGQMTVPGMSSAMGAVPNASTADVSAPAIVPSACSYSSSTQSFTCPTVTSNGLTITRSYTLLDAQGQPQSAPDKATTDGIRTETKVSGTITAHNTTTTVAGDKVLTLTGLLANQPLLNGTDNSTLSGSTTSGSTSVPFTITETGTVDKLALPPKGSTTHYPQSGTVGMTIASTFGPTGATTTTNSSFSLEFTGSNLATLTLTNSLGTRVCTIDLTGQTAMSCK